ncbi:hypothetical protein LR48_Vigan118s000500 [Vigna angularis]|uniref:Uncharacterized protein n=1 Tax=Phaseolus angularis TaxID=3914 RepID=A0A0L9T4N0_PHAAN|nr:hypothetical protein LR48_Vigan118s000500 [Vigna angularis]
MKRMIVKNNDTQHDTQAHNTWGHIVNHPPAPQSATPKVQSSPSPSTPQKKNQVFSFGQPPNEVVQSPVEVDQQENSHVQDEHEQDENQDILLEVQQQRPSTYKRSWLVDVIDDQCKMTTKHLKTNDVWNLPQNERIIKIPKDYKEDIIHNTIQTKFVVNFDIQINYILKLLNHKWRDSRQELWQQRDDGTRTRDELIAMAPEGIDKDHWASFVDYRLDERTKEKECGHKVSRGEVWIATHKKTNGAYVSDEARKIGPPRKPSPSDTLQWCFRSSIPLATQIARKNSQNYKHRHHSKKWTNRSEDFHALEPVLLGTASPSPCSCSDCTIEASAGVAMVDLVVATAGRQGPVTTMKNRRAVVWRGGGEQRAERFCGKDDGGGGAVAGGTETKGRWCGGVAAEAKSSGEEGA